MANFKHVNDEKFEDDLDSCLAKQLSRDIDDFLNDSTEDDFWFDQNMNPIFSLPKRNRDGVSVGKDCRLQRGRLFKKTMLAIPPIILVIVGVVFLLTPISKQSGAPTSPVAQVEKMTELEADYEEFEFPDDVGESADTLISVKNCIVEKLLATSTEVDFFKMDVFSDIGRQSSSQSSESENWDRINQAVSFNEIASREFTERESSSPKEPLDPSNEISKFAVSLSPTLYLMNRIRENW